MVSRSFDQWANDLAASIAAKNPQKGSTELSTSSFSNPTEKELIENFLKLFPTDKDCYEERRIFIGNLIGDTFTWVDSPEGVEFWHEVYQKIMKM